MPGAHFHTRNLETWALTTFSDPDDLQRSRDNVTNTSKAVGKCYLFDECVTVVSTRWIYRQADG